MLSENPIPLQIDAVELKTLSTEEQYEHILETALEFLKLYLDVNTELKNRAKGLSRKQKGSILFSLREFMVSTYHLKPNKGCPDLRRKNKTFSLKPSETQILHRPDFALQGGTYAKIQLLTPAIQVLTPFDSITTYQLKGKNQTFALAGNLELFMQYGSHPNGLLWPHISKLRRNYNLESIKTFGSIAEELALSIDRSKFFASAIRGGSPGSKG